MRPSFGNKPIKETFAKLKESAQWEADHTDDIKNMGVPMQDILGTIYGESSWAYVRLNQVEALLKVRHDFSILSDESDNDAKMIDAVDSAIAEMYKRAEKAKEEPKSVDTVSDDITTRTIYALGKPVQISMTIRLDVDSKVSIHKINEALTRAVREAKYGNA